MPFFTAPGLAGDNKIALSEGGPVLFFTLAEALVTPQLFLGAVCAAPIFLSTYILQHLFSPFSVSQSSRIYIV
jgi:hypothetical protein